MLVRLSSDPPGAWDGSWREDVAGLATEQQGGKEQSGGVQGKPSSKLNVALSCWKFSFISKGPKSWAQGDFLPSLLDSLPCLVLLFWPFLSCLSDPGGQSDPRSQW